MRALGRAVLLLVVACALVAAGVPPPLTEDRSVPGYCSPDCPLQHDGQSVAVPPVPPGWARSAGPARERPQPAPASAPPALPASADAPRAPPAA